MGTATGSFLRSWHGFYDPGVPPELAIPSIRLQEFPRQVAQKWPEREALVADGVRWSYAELVAHCQAFAERLIALGVDGRRLLARPAADPVNPLPDETRPVVLLWLPNVPAFVSCYYGSLEAGCMVSAASPALTVAELAAQCRDCAPSVVVTLTAMAGGAREALAAAGVTARVEVVDGNGVVGDRRPEFGGRETPVHASEVAVLQYTSGTTGQAKGAVMTQRNLVANALQNAHWFGWEREQSPVRTLAVLPLCHTWGMCCMMNSTMAVGGALILADQRGGFDPDATAARVAEHGATVLYGSATMFHRLLDCADDAARRRRAGLLTSLRHVKAGAMLTQGDLKARWDAFCPPAPLQQGYGLTEASPESHNNPVGAFRRGTVGVPIQSTDCRICDPGDPARVLPAGEAGEVQLSGPQITSGYWRRPAATAAAFAPGGWLRTGDIGVMDGDGYLTIVDRMKDLIKFRGFSVSPNAVEDCLLRHPQVAEAVVVGRNDERDGEVPVACIVPVGMGRPQAPMDERVVAVEAPGGLAEALRAHAEVNLGGYERPRDWRFLAAIPKNHVAKPLRRVLREWVNGG